MQIAKVAAASYRPSDATRAASRWRDGRGPLLRIVTLVSFALMLIAVAVPVQAQRDSPERHKAKIDGAIREMGADARMKNMTDRQQQDLVEFVTGNMLFVGFHELGHALVGQLRLPVLGREEDAADSFATLAMLEAGTDFSVNVLVQAARGWFLMDRRDRKEGDAFDFYDAHGLDQQRAFNIVCLMVGSDDKQFKELADWVQLPDDRRQSCRYDYENAKYSWGEVLKPHLRPDDQPKSPITITYEPAKGKLDTLARSFRAIGFLETLADYASRYVLPKPIALVMKSCGDTNAWWDPPSLTETLCYEMAEDFVELYNGYTEKKPAPGKKMALNELIARNIKRIRLAHNMSMGSLASSAGMSEAWVGRVERGLETGSVDQLEKLASALKVETAEFFMSPANKPTATAAKPRTRK